MRAFTDIYAPIIGRILMGGFFLWEGIEKSLYFGQTVSALAMVSAPAPLWTAALIIALEAVGGIALIVGFKTRITALVLAIFMILSSLLFMNFNSEFGVSLFLQSMAIAGGLLYMSAFGSGSWDSGWPYKRR